MIDEPFDPPPPPPSLSFWDPIEADLRTFLALTTERMGNAYDAMWQELRSNISNSADHYPSGVPDSLDFYERFGLLQDDYLWMLRAAVLRDAVTAFEVYLEKAVDAVLNREVELGNGERGRLRWNVKPHRSPTWESIVKVHGVLGCDLNTPTVKYVRELRHLLTHQRGELRTDQQRLGFSQDAGNRRGLSGTDRDVSLSARRVEAMLNDLANAVRSCEDVSLNYYWDNDVLPIEQLFALTRERPASLVWDAGLSRTGDHG